MRVEMRSGHDRDVRAGREPVLLQRTVVDREFDQLRSDLAEIADRRNPRRRAVARDFLARALVTQQQILQGTDLRFDLGPEICESLGCQRPALFLEQGLHGWRSAPARSLAPDGDLQRSTMRLDMRDVRDAEVVRVEQL